MCVCAFFFQIEPVGRVVPVAVYTLVVEAVVTTPHTYPADTDIYIYICTSSLGCCTARAVSRAGSRCTARQGALEKR